MKAAVLYDVGRLAVREVPTPRPGPREVLLRVAAVGLCGTDWHIFAGHGNYHRDERGRPIPLAREPQILGHEIAGIVEEAGTAVHDLQPGDRVVVDQGRSCVSEGRSLPCEYCASGDSHQCEQYQEHGITGLPGGLAEYLAIPAVNAVRIEAAPDAASPALTEPLGCVVHASDVLLRTSARYELQSGKGGKGGQVRCAMICGAGPAGLLWVQYLRNVLGFDGMLLVSEPSAAKRALAEGFGAETIDPTAVDLVDAVLARTYGRRVELLVEATGSGTMLASIAPLVRKQATVLLYGHGHAGVDVSVLSQLRVDVAPLITHRYRSLDQVPGAFTGDYAAPDYIKGVVTL